MGCASSGPIGKNLVDGAKETANDVAHMGGNVLHDASDVAKDGMEHVKEALESAVHTAEHGLGTVVHKIEETIGLKKDEAHELSSEMKEAINGFEDAADDVANKADNIVEEISETETVLASEAEEKKERLLTRTETILESIPSKLEETLKVEDMEELADDAMGSTVTMEAKKDVEELVTKAPTPAPTPPPEVKADPPTPWEIAADAILHRPVIRANDLNQDGGEESASSTAEAPTDAAGQKNDEEKLSEDISEIMIEELAKIDNHNNTEPDRKIEQIID